MNIGTINIESFNINVTVNFVAEPKPEPKAEPDNQHLHLIRKFAQAEKIREMFGDSTANQFLAGAHIKDAA